MATFHTMTEIEKRDWEQVLDFRHIPQFGASRQINPYEKATAISGSDLGVTLRMHATLRLEVE
jgi:hypothetical protein